MITDFQKKLNTLSVKLQDILLSDYNRIISLKIRDKYKLPFGVGNLFDELVSKLYFGELLPTDLFIEIKNNLKVTDEIAKKITVDVLGMRVLPAIDVSQAIIDLGGQSKDYEKYVTTFKKVVADEKAGTYDRNEYLYEDEPQPKRPVIKEDEFEEIGKELTIEERKMQLENFLKESLDDVLSLENSLILKDINEELVEVLSANESISKHLSGILMKQEILIGGRNIVLGNKELPPTMSNWLKDFFSVAGTEHFDTLNIAKYIITSDNAKKLNEVDQAKLRRFLIFYHNINFFPTPFSAIPVDKWEIIPGALNAEISSTPIVSTPAPSSVSKPMIPNPPKVIKPKPKFESKPLTSAPTPTSTPASTPSAAPESPELLELKNMLLQYPVGSLERSAIEEEIKKLTG